MFIGKTLLITGGIGFFGMSDKPFLHTRIKEFRIFS